MRQMKRLAALLLVALMAFISGCGYKESVGTQERAAYIYFTGNAQGAEVTIDETTTFTVEKMGADEHYKVAPGKHLIVVTQDGAVVVERELLLGDGIAREINVP